MHVYAEPRIALDTGSFLKPDLIAVSANRSVVCDPSIVGASVNPVAAGRTKVELYDRPEVRRFVVDLAKSLGIRRVHDAEIFGVIVSWRGAWCPVTWARLRRLGLSETLLNWLTIRLLLRTHAMWFIETVCR